MGLARLAVSAYRATQGDLPEEESKKHGPLSENRASWFPPG
jgi:hypothetical protein